MPVAPHVPGTTRSPTTPLPGVSPLLQIDDLLTPGPSAQDTAAAAQRLGVTPKSVAGGIGAAASSLLHTASEGVNEISKDVADLPKQRVNSVLGRKTLGSPTVAQVAGAVVRGQTRVNKSGKLTIPPTRHAAQRLAHLRQQQAKSATIPGLSPEEQTFVRAVSKGTGGILHPRTVAAWTHQEGGNSTGDWNRLNIGHTDSGALPLTADPRWKNPEQAGKLTAAFLRGEYGGPSKGISEILPKAKGLPPAQQLQVIAGSGWAGDPEYNAHLQGVLSTIPGSKPRPGLAAKVEQAKLVAQKLGIPTAGDTEPGPQPKTVFVRADAEGFVKWAKALLGTQEGSKLQLKWAAGSGISAADPWCAAFIAAGIARRGLTPPPGAANSQSWMTWNQGTNIGTDIRKAKPGDIIVIGAGDHIGLYTGGGNMIAGNWSDEVSEYPVASDSRGVEGIIRPHFKGGKVAVKESAVLPGAAIGPSGELVSGPAGTAEGGTAAQQGSRPAPVSLGSVPVSPLLATAAPLPAAFGGQQSLESLSPEEVNSMVATILKRKRL